MDHMQTYALATNLAESSPHLAQVITNKASQKLSHGVFIFKTNRPLQPIEFWNISDIQCMIFTIRGWSRGQETL